MDIGGNIDSPAADAVREAVETLVQRLTAEGTSRPEVLALIAAEVSRQQGGRPPADAPPSPDAPMRDEPANDWPSA
ncbi:hypothetical protein BJF93_22580 [Xaviernesmea oryzae]|uniref:Uncharacterized protein n=1 Tax=Xaviernesmea oryzae TaxID=464029 RepID=A0A1Q9B364_9HYPH|nr:hypothetical protein [Xaviernesmea oryzae]OLP62450.1 hypothetical protein BJF93_22580 [Xaviernesmea oryzae]SEM16803.1 hypothetical protein SAMN04487976_12146 [Xaviernesmea oryzae]